MLSKLIQLFKNLVNFKNNIYIKRRVSVWQEKNQTVSGINITSIELKRLRQFIVANRENLAIKFNYETNEK